LIALDLYLIRICPAHYCTYITCYDRS